MVDEIEIFRIKTLQNNITWLESFGCQILREDGLISIDHAMLRDLSVRLIINGPERALRGLKEFFGRKGTAQQVPDIYVDENLNSFVIRSALISSGFKVAAINATKFSTWRPEADEKEIHLEAASLSDCHRWSTLYSTGFARRGYEAELDRYRWQQSFNSPSVHHWFLVDGSDLLGVCQTCVDSGVTGIYSFTLTQEARATNKLRPALRALRAKLTEYGQINVYFERLWTKDSLNKLNIRDDPHGFMVIRKMIGYRHQDKI